MADPFESQKSAVYKKARLLFMERAAIFFTQAYSEGRLREYLEAAEKVYRDRCPQDFGVTSDTVRYLLYCMTTLDCFLVPIKIDCRLDG